MKSPVFQESATGRHDQELHYGVQTWWAISQHGEGRIIAAVWMTFCCWHNFSGFGWIWDNFLAPLMVCHTGCCFFKWFWNFGKPMSELMELQHATLWKKRWMLDESNSLRMEWEDQNVTSTVVLLCVLMGLRAKPAGGHSTHPGSLWD